jgi:hypothetical protein
MPERDHEPCSSFILRLLGDAEVAYVCELCPEDTIKSTVDRTEQVNSALTSHCRCDSHAERVRQVMSMQRNEMIAWAAKLQHRLELLSDRIWQMNVQSKLFHILLNHRVWEVAKFSYGHLKAEAELLVSQRENKERRVSLTLAIWKALCIASPDNIENNYHWWNTWHMSGWRRGKARMQQTNEIQAVLSSILPFLGYISDVQSELGGQFEVMPFKAYHHANSATVRYGSKVVPYAIASSAGDRVHMCDVCEEGFLTQEDVQAHCDSAKHKGQIDQIRAVQCTWGAKIQTQMDNLPWAPWQLEVQSQMFWILLYENVWKWDFKKAKKGEVVAVIHDHQTQERVHLVGLMAWKALCLAKFSSNNGSFMAWREWVSGGWKEYKNEMCNSNGLDIIVSHVHPYLDTW